MEMIPNRNNKGIALIVTLTIITLLVTISLELNRQVRSAVTDSAAFRDRATLRHMIRSGVAMAETILARDKKDTEVDSVQEDWANPEKIDAYLSQLALDKGELSIRISDELSRIQVNALVKFPKGREFNENQQKLWYRFITLILEQ
ncbi:MAG: type II secretion system protein GspK, partial [Desulfobacterales bacterium]